MIPPGVRRTQQSGLRLLLVIRMSRWGEVAQVERSRGEEGRAKAERRVEDENVERERGQRDGRCSLQTGVGVGASRRGVAGVRRRGNGDMGCLIG